MLSESEIYGAIWSRSELLFTPEEFHRLKNAVVGVAGIGGGGCIATEMLARLGVGHLRLADPDCFDPSNLNRQLFATTSTLGRPKVEVGRDRVLDINPYCKVEIFSEGITRASVEAFMEGLTVAVTQVDVLGPDVLLHRIAARQKVPVVKGSRSGYPGHRWEVKAFVWDYRSDGQPATPEEWNELKTRGLTWEQLTEEHIKSVNEETHEKMRQRLNERVAAGDAAIFRPRGSSGDYMSPFRNSPDNIYRTVCAPIANGGGMLAALEALKVILSWENSQAPVHLLR
jgi:tRNA threonylcarbamoyladenosine dehydratase